MTWQGATALSASCCACPFGLSGVPPVSGLGKTNCVSVSVPVSVPTRFLFQRIASRFLFSYPTLLIKPFADRAVLVVPIGSRFLPNRLWLFLREPNDISRAPFLVLEGTGLRRCVPISGDSKSIRSPVRANRRAVIAFELA